MSLDVERSPRIAAVFAGEADAESLWEAARAAGRPLIDSIDGTDDEVLVTFVWRGSSATGRIGVQSALVPGMQIFHPLEQLPGSDIWVRSYRIPADLHTTYAFLPEMPEKTGLDSLSLDDIKAAQELFLKIVPDPLNPRTNSMDLGELPVVTVSIVEGPDAPRYEQAEPRDGAARGLVEEHHVPSAALDAERRVWVYTPPHFDPARKHGIVLLFDGQVQDTLRLTTILDNLISDGQIPPVIGLFVDSIGSFTRMGDLGLSDAFIDFLRDDLLTWARGRLPLSDDPSDNVVTGASLGGLTTSFVALRMPEVFGNALPLSGSYFFERDDEKEWLLARYAEADTITNHFYMEVGAYEDLLVPGNRQLRDTLLEKGCDVTYHEYNGGHDAVGWTGSLVRGLPLLLGKGRQ